MATAPENTPASAVVEAASKQILILDEDHDSGDHPTTLLDDRGESLARPRSWGAEHYLG